MKNIMNKMWTGLKFIGKWITCPIWGPLYLMYCAGLWTFRKVSGLFSRKSSAEVPVEEAISEEPAIAKVTWDFISSQLDEYEKDLIKNSDDDKDDSSEILAVCEKISHMGDFEDCLVVYDPEGQLRHSLPDHYEDEEKVLDSYCIDSDEYDIPDKFDRDFVQFNIIHRYDNDEGCCGDIVKDSLSTIIFIMEEEENNIVFSEPTYAYCNGERVNLEELHND